MLRLIRFLICISVFCVGSLLAQTEQGIKTKLAIPDSNQVQILKTKDGSQLILINKPKLLKILSTQCNE